MVSDRERTPVLCVRGRHYLTGEPIEILCGQEIECIQPATDSHSTDVAGQWVAPALFDLQINGCEGRSFNSPEQTIDDVRYVVDACLRHGIAGLLATVITASRETLLQSCKILRQAREQDAIVRRAVCGVHLEGPFISAEDGPRGAHPAIHVRPPDWDEFLRLQEAAGGLVRLVTLAPDLEGALGFIERLVASGVIAAIGHTAARPSRIREAVRAGASLSTHLGNGCHALLPRHENYLWEQLACDELWASIIADGHHLPPALLRCLFRVKGPARSILTCDASSLAGLPPGHYVEWDQELEVLPGGRVVLAGTEYLAGSGVFTDHCVAHAVKVGGIRLADALDMACARPRELLNLPAHPLAVGAPADLVLLDAQLALVAMVSQGEVIRPN